MRRKSAVALTGTVGPEVPNNNHDDQTLLDLVATYALAHNLLLGINCDWGFGNGTAADVGYGQWFGVLGVTVTPFPQNRVASTLRLRPEVRDDWANDLIYDNATDSPQITVAIDAIWSF